MRHAFSSNSYHHLLQRSHGNTSFSDSCKATESTMLGIVLQRRIPSQSSCCCTGCTVVTHGWDTPSHAHNAVDARDVPYEIVKNNISTECILYYLHTFFLWPVYYGILHCHLKNNKKKWCIWSLHLHIFLWLPINVY